MTGKYQWPYATPGVVRRYPDLPPGAWRDAWLEITGKGAALQQRDPVSGVERYLVTLGGRVRQVEYQPHRAAITAVFEHGGLIGKQRFKRARARDRKERDS